MSRTQTMIMVKARALKVDKMIKLAHHNKITQVDSIQTTLMKTENLIHTNKIIAMKRNDGNSCPFLDGKST